MDEEYIHMKVAHMYIRIYTQIRTYMYIHTTYIRTVHAYICVYATTMHTLLCGSGVIPTAGEGVCPG